MKEEEFYRSRYRDDLARSEVFELLKEQQIEMILDLSLGNIDEKELKGMVKLVAKTGNWRKEYDKKLEQKKKENN